MTLKIRTILIVVLGLTQANADSVLNKICGYNLIESEQKHSLNLSLDADIEYTISANQNGCIMNVSEIYENITKHIFTDRAEIYVSVAFSCYPSEQQSDIHFSSSGALKELDLPRISVQISLGICSTYMDELAHFQTYGRIWSIVTTNSSQIYPGLSCSSLKDLRILSSNLLCPKQGNNELVHAKSFYWEFCEDPFEQVFNLRLQGCSSDYYTMRQTLLQSKFPKLQTLWLKYMNLTTVELTFPWTNVYIDSSDANIISYLTHYKESRQEDTTSIGRSVSIYDSDVNFESNVMFYGYITKIVINNVKLTKLTESIFRNIKDMKVLGLSSNKISEIDKNVFLFQNKLQLLHLSHNDLATLPDGVFDNLENLSFLDLSSNRIARLDQRLFKHLIRLQELNLESNRITTLPPEFLQTQIKSIRYVFLSKNPLETIPLNAFYAPRLELLDIRQCNISSSGIQSLIDNINIYELQTGYSESLTYDPLGAVGKLPLQSRSIDMTQNYIEEIPIDLTKSETLLKVRYLLETFRIIIEDNPLDCTCQMILTTLLAELFLQEGILIKWKCMYPLELRGQFVATIDTNQSYCKVNIENCPRKCACFQKYGSQIFIDITNRTRVFIIDCRNINMTYMPELMPPGQLELWFQNASLVEITPRQYLKSTTVLEASYNRINVLSSATALALRSVSTVKLDHNNFTYFPEQITTGNISVLTLSSNPFLCDCNTKWMKTWLLRRTSPVIDWNTIECTYNTSKVKQLISVPDSMFVCTEVSNFSISKHVIIPSIVVGSILFVLVSLSLLLYFKRFTVKVLLYLYCGFHVFDKQDDVHTNTTYDAFILYSHTDSVFIRKNVVEKLKTKGYRVADMYGDLIAGFSYLQNFETFINRSRRVIFCWTVDMLENDFILSAWKIVYEKALKNKMNSIIQVVDANLKQSNCSDEKLRMFLKSGKFIKKNSKYMYASVEYLMPRTGIDTEVSQTIDADIEENTVPMLQACYNMNHARQNEFVYLSYPDDQDIEIRQQLVPYLGRMGHNVKIFEHDIMPGADIRDEIHHKINNSRQFIFIISREIIHDEVKMFILTTVLSKSKLCNNNYLLLFTSGQIQEAYLTNELEHYFNNFVTGSVKDPNFRGRLLQALNSNDIIQDEITISC